MTTIRTPCPMCEVEVDVPAEGVLLVIGEEDEEGTYCFVCPTCGLQDKPAPPKLAAVLIEAGVPHERGEALG
jgi:hypothetical protein